MLLNSIELDLIIHDTIEFVKCFFCEIFVTVRMRVSNAEIPLTEILPQPGGFIHDMGSDFLRAGAPDMLFVFVRSAARS